MPPRRRCHPPPQHHRVPRRPLPGNILPLPRRRSPPTLMPPPPYRSPSAARSPSPAAPSPSLAASSPPHPSTSRRCSRTTKTTLAPGSTTTSPLPSSGSSPTKGMMLSPGTRHFKWLSGWALTWSRSTGNQSLRVADVEDAEERQLQVGVRGVQPACPCSACTPSASAPPTTAVLSMTSALDGNLLAARDQQHEPLREKKPMDWSDYLDYIGSVMEAMALRIFLMMRRCQSHRRLVKRVRRERDRVGAMRQRRRPTNQMLHGIMFYSVSKFIDFHKSSPLPAGECRSLATEGDMLDMD